MIDTIEISCTAAFESPGDHWTRRTARTGWLQGKPFWHLDVGPLHLKAYPDRAHPEDPSLPAVQAPTIYAEVSLPAWRFGHNAKLLTLQECVEALHDLHARVVKEAVDARGIPDLTSWHVHRVDLAHDWVVGDDRFVYILDTWAAVNKNKTHSFHLYLDGGRDGGGGWEVRAPGWRRLLYDKDGETRKKWPGRLKDIQRRIENRSDGWAQWKSYGLDLEEIVAQAAGKLRFEVAFNTQEKVAATLQGLKEKPWPRATVALLIEHLLKRGQGRLSEVWEETVEDWTSLSEFQALEVLKEEYGGTTAVHLFAFWYLRKKWGAEVVRDRCGLKDSTWYAWTKQLREAGLENREGAELVRLTIPPFPDAAEADRPAQ